jgi:hypothetical protein
MDSVGFNSLDNSVRQLNKEMMPIQPTGEGMMDNESRLGRQI